MKKICVAFHSGSLKACLASELDITEDAFRKLTDSGLYEFYAYDKRINADRFILHDMEHNIGLPTWIHVYR